MKATIYYFDWDKTTRDDRWEMYEGKVADSSKYDRVVTLEVEANTTEECLERLFERFNIGDHAGLRVRSMSVGDVVVVGNEAYFCASLGWKPLKDAVVVDAGPVVTAWKAHQVTEA